MVDWLEVASKTLGAIPGVAAFAGPRIARYRLRRVARDLGRLRLWSEGIREPLTRLAAGEEDPRIIAELDSTEGEVARVAARLRDARNGLAATDRNMEIANDLDALLHGKVGPGAIRDRLRQLVEAEKGRPELAAEVLEEMENFDIFLEDVAHEAIRPKPMKAAAQLAKRRGRP